MALRATGMEFASEMVARAGKIGLSITEVPVDYHPRLGASKLRTYRDGWRHLRFLLMYSPMGLYMVPSAILGTAGLGLLLLLALAPLEFLGRRWDVHLAAVASLLTVLASQLAWLGISARTLAVVHGFDPPDPFVTHFYRRFSLEYGLAFATALCLVGGLIGGLIIWRWTSQGFPPLDAIRPLLLAVTLIIVGVQSGFNAFFLSLLGIQVRAVRQ
jgi:hypothetical protein